MSCFPAATRHQFVHDLQSAMRDVVSCGSAGEVHALRSAALRASVALALLGWRALRNDLRWLRRTAGRLRDWDVSHGAAAPAQRSALVHELQAQLHSARAQCLPDALARVLQTRAPSHHLGPQGQLQSLARRALGTHDPHRLRQRLRRLRLALDMLGLTHDAGAMREVVDRLGRWHDELQAPQSSTLDRTYKKARRSWRRAAPIVRRYAS